MCVCVYVYVCVRVYVVWCVCVYVCVCVVFGVVPAQKKCIAPTTILF